MKPRASSLLAVAPALSRILSLGTIPASGTITRTLNVGNLPPASEVLTAFLQLAALDAQGLWFGGARVQKRPRGKPVVSCSPMLPKQFRSCLRNSRSAT